MSSTAESASTICRLMDAQITDKQFDAAVARNKLLHDCKTKGFKRLKSLGRFAGGIEVKEPPKTIQMDPFEFASMGAKLVNEGKMSIKSWAEQCGRNAWHLRYYCDKYGIELKRKAIPADERERIYVKARQLINRYGNRLNVTAQRCGVSATFLHDIFRSKGRVYNAKTIRIERIKK